MSFPKRASGEVLDGAHDCMCEGLSLALTPSRAIPRDRLSCRCSAAHASLKRGLSSDLSRWPGKAQEGSWRGRCAEDRKESSRPHSVSLTPLTSPAHQAEVLPPAPARARARAQAQARGLGHP